MKIGKVEETSIVSQMQKSYLDYAMSVIVSRALPDIRDGLKPVHRRILYAMHRLGLNYTARYTKSAKVVGETMGKYHPHGDMAIYDALVRLAQTFSMRYPLIDGQGNFGSIDGDPPAAMRYTEVKMAKITQEILSDIEKETVPFLSNFDDTLLEPVFLPAKLPNLLLMGGDGIAVGMATKIPPHNLQEVVDALIFIIDNREKDYDQEQLLKFIQGPDFPTGASIYDYQEIKNAYLTGRGKIIIRGKAEIEELEKGKQVVVISELPFQVNKSTLVAKIADLAKQKKIIGISDLRDESDRRGIRVVVELKRDARPKAVLNNLYKNTQLQTTFPLNLVALLDGVPRTLTLKAILEHYLLHRHEVVTKRSEFELKNAKQRAHILEGLKIAVKYIDEVIGTIKRSKDAEQAKQRLMKKFKLTEIQATAILDMQLRRLAALEREKIEDEYQMLLETITYLEDLLAHPEKIYKIIKAELLKLKEVYGDPRKTKVFKNKVGEFEEEDLIADEPTIVTITKTGYIKRLPIATYKTQRRGGKGVIGMTTKEEDEIVKLLTCQTHDNLLFFTNYGRVYQVRVWEIPQGSRQSKGKAVINLINIEQGEKVTSVLSYLSKEASKADQKFISHPRDFGGKKPALPADPPAGRAGRDADPRTETFKHRARGGFIFMTTKKGKVKKTPLASFLNIRSSGLIAIKLVKEDELCWAKITSGNDQIILITRHGKGIRFNEVDARPMGRDTIGVKGINLKENDFVVGMESIPKKLPPTDKRRIFFQDLLIISEKGLGKRTATTNFPLQKRGGIGVKAVQIKPKTGLLVCAKLVDEKVDKLILTSKTGQVIKLPLKSVPKLGRATQGVIIMRFAKGGDGVAGVATVKKP